jgi:hypothetical protein
MLEIALCIALSYGLTAPTFHLINVTSMQKNSVPGALFISFYERPIHEFLN